MMIGMKAADHLFCIRTVPGGLEIVGLKAGVIFRKSKEKVVRVFPTAAHFLAQTQIPGWNPAAG
mgnify:CR=1 FL=1